MKKQFDKIHQVICEGLACQFMKANPFVIGNNCIASFIYNFAKTQFNHPFTYAFIDVKNILFLAKNFDAVNFDNVEFKFAYDERRRRQYVKARIDGKIDVCYVHYFKTADNDAMKDVEGKYFRRVARMKDLKQRPLFILDIDPCTMDIGLRQDVEETLTDGNMHVIYEKPGKNGKTDWMPKHRNCFICPHMNYNRLLNMKYIVLRYLNDIFERNRQ